MYDILFLIMVVLSALAYDFVNGFHDASNAIGTSIASKALSPKKAILLAVTFNFLGALAHTAVAYTIGKGVVNSEIVTNQMLFSALIGAITWGIITWKFSLPSSSTHALVGGLIGSSLVLSEFDFSVLVMPGIIKIILAMIIAPIVGIIVSGLLITLTIRILYALNFRKRPFNRKMKKVQIISAAWMSFTHGMNDAQNAMGIIVIALMSYGALDHFEVPMIVRILCAAAMGAGTWFGGWNIIRTIINQSGEEPMPLQGASAQTSSGVVIFLMSLLGIPISTSHAVASCVMGTTAASVRVGAVDWRLGSSMIKAWIFTIPASAVISGVVQLIMQQFN